MSDEAKHNREVTLFDRLSVGMLSGFLAVITYGFIWCLFAFFSEGDLLLPIELFFIFVVGMFLLGFFTLDNYFIEILIPIWNFIIRIFQ